MSTTIAAPFPTIESDKKTARNGIKNIKHFPIEEERSYGPVVEISSPTGASSSDHIPLQNYPILPISMEEYFSPGFKTKPAIHIGSQTMRLFHGIPKEQAFEGWHLAGVSEGDIAVVRNFDPLYISYWKSLMGHNTEIVNITDENGGEFLSEYILNHPEILHEIQEKQTNQRALMIFLPTLFEERLSHQLRIPLHGSTKISQTYGTKSGIRNLANEFLIDMPEGYICKSVEEIKRAVNLLQDHFSHIVIKHDLSMSGLFSKKLDAKNPGDLEHIVHQLSGGNFMPGKDIFVVEGWVKGKASLCAHIEILPGEKPIICGAWQQVIDTDGITYIGAGPLQLSRHAMESFHHEVTQLANALHSKGAIGSFGPDFIIVSDDDNSGAAHDNSLLIELNARVPYTAFPLEAIKQIKGTIGNNFLSSHIHVKKPISFQDIMQVLKNEHLLITEKNPSAEGVIPFNVGLLPWKIFDVVAISSSWEKTQYMIKRIKNIFSSEVDIPLDFSSHL